MQGVEEEKQARSRFDEERINRPLHNFKHKKYLVSKFEEAMMVEAKSSLLKQKKLEEVNIALQCKPVATAAAQPPLPPNPPPPDTPPKKVDVIQENEDSDHNICGTPIRSYGLKNSNELIGANKTDHSEEKPKVTMCRNYVRGTCKKGNACIFAHKIILSQLPGIYIFCKNYQNSMCSLKKCKFVHATVFEKEHFFRTGYLPPHAVAHLKEFSVVQQPHLPPKSKEASAGLPRRNCNAEPSAPMPCVSSALLPYDTVAAFEQSDQNTYNTLQSPASTPPKRAWREIGEASCSTRALDSRKLLAKKCKNCDNNELREQLMKAKVDKATRANKEFGQKIKQIETKNALRRALYRVFLRPTTSPSASNNGSQSSAEQELYSLLRNNHNWKSTLSSMLRRVEAMLPPETS